MPTKNRTIVDLSHSISHEMLTHPWMPKPRVTEFISREQSASFLAPGVTFALTQVELCGNTGTYIDAPNQFHVDGADVAGLSLERMVDIPITVIRVPPEKLSDGRSIGPEVFKGFELAGQAVLINTGHDRHWGTGGFFKDSPFLTGDAVRALLDAGPGIVGIDSQNIDSGTDNSKPAQNLLLGADIYVLETLTRLDQLPDTGARLTVLPTPIAGIGSYPVRAIAVIDR
ncbi:cyclase family protein [Nonomuraea sp. NPDC050556]|uniref:cyclase family protein n=1 Tax=Nonomuraea sp. NPDC050556 TaxID=3364369 RepID=UPI00379A42FD